MVNRKQFIFLAILPLTCFAPLAADSDIAYREGGGREGRERGMNNDFSQYDKQRRYSEDRTNRQFNSFDNRRFNDFDNKRFDAYRRPEGEINNYQVYPNNYQAYPTYQVNPTYPAPQTSYPYQYQYQNQYYQNQYPQ